MSDDDVVASWSQYKDTGSVEARDALILNYLPLVKYVANRVGAGLPQSVEVGDLISYGTFGLIDAIEKFDPERGFKFETYAISRIKGAILDELRSIDWIPRSIRSKQRLVENAIREFETKNHRQPTDTELANILELSVKKVRAMRRLSTTTYITTLDEVFNSDGDGDGDYTLGETIASREVDVEDGYTSAHDVENIRSSLASAASSMNTREQMVLILYYHEGLTLAEIGQVLGVTESRICQIHTKAVLSLRERLTSSPSYEPF